MHGVLLDLGVSSPQIDEPSRGFSFRFDAPLDMRMDTSRGETAADFLARADERQIAEVIRDYGEERFAVPIAKALVARRAGGRPVGRTVELAEVVARAVKTREPGQDPATRTFQALRIFVNAELEDLEQGLSAAMDLLMPNGRLVVISFHSLEDRIVKRFIARESRSEPDRRAPFAPPAPTAAEGAGARAAHRRRGAGQPARTIGRDAGGRAHGDEMTRTHLVLLLALIFSCLALVQTSYESRRLFDETNRARDELARLDAEAQRLEAERQAQATHLRVEKVAREKLAMRTVTPAVTHFVVDSAASRESSRNDAAASAARRRP